MRGYKEEGTTTTPFDMVVLNTLDRFHLVMDVANRVPKLQGQAAHIKQRMRDKLNEHTQYIHQSRRGYARNTQLEMAAVSRTILTLNSGSSSLKASLFRADGTRRDWRYTHIGQHLRIITRSF